MGDDRDRKICQSAALSSHASVGISTAPRSVTAQRTLKTLSSWLADDVPKGCIFISGLVHDTIKGVEASQ